jgi:hypothetical protein
MVVWYLLFWRRVTEHLAPLLGTRRNGQLASLEARLLEEKKNNNKRVADKLQIHKICGVVVTHFGEPDLCFRRFSTLLMAFLFSVGISHKRKVVKIGNLPLKSDIYSVSLKTL